MPNEPMSVGKTDWIWPYSALVGVVDGDTADYELVRDIGFHGKTVFRQRLRLNRIDAPKASVDLGKQAITWVTNNLSMRSLLIETIKPYKYGDEWMAEVTLPDGRNVSDELVRVGLATYWDGKGPRPGG